MRGFASKRNRHTMFFVCDWTEDLRYMKVSPHSITSSDLFSVSLCVKMKMRELTMILKIKAKLRSHDVGGFFDYQFPLSDHDESIVLSIPPLFPL